MTETETNLVRINAELRSQIDETIHSIKDMGIRRYKSVPEFVEKACIEWLKKEKPEVKAQFMANVNEIIEKLERYADYLEEKLKEFSK